MERLDQTPSEKKSGYETWLDDGIDPTTAARIKGGAKFKVLDDEWVDGDERRGIRLKRIIRRAELV